MIWDRPWVVVSAGVYLAAMLSIGLWAARRTHDARDFFIAGQRVGLFVTALAAMSASFSGFAFVGGPGLTYRIGIASLFINAPVAITAGMLCWVLAKRLRWLAAVREVYTIPDALYHRYGSRLVSGLGAVAILVGTLGYLGAQFLAAGRLIESTFGTRELLGPWSLAVAMALGMIVVVFYAAAGGMMASVYTDLVQGLLMMFVAVAVFYYALDAGGGVAGIAESLLGSEAFGAGFLDPLGRVPLTTAMGFFFVFGIGVLGQPHVVHKFFMLDDPAKLRWFPWILGGSQSLCILIWIGIGLAVPALVTEGRLAPLANPDDAAPVFLLGFTPEVLAGLTVAGILAAIMSTADSFLNLASAVLVRDLPRAFGREVPNQLRWGRWATLGVALVAGGFAYAYDDLIALLGTFAFGTFGAALAPVLAIGMSWKRVTRSAAAASIATGAGLNLMLEFLARQSYFPALPKPPLPPGVLPTAVSLAASFTVLFAVTAWTTRHHVPELPADVEAVMEV